MLGRFEHIVGKTCTRRIQRARTGGEHNGKKAIERTDRQRIKRTLHLKRKKEEKNCYSQ